MLFIFFKWGKIIVPCFNVDPLHKVKTPKVHNSRQCAPMGCTRQGVGSFHSLETTLHSLQPTYLRPLIHTIPNFKFSRYTLTALNISQLQTFICLFKTALTRTTKQLTLLIYTTVPDDRFSRINDEDISVYILRIHRRHTKVHNYPQYNSVRHFWNQTNNIKTWL